MVATRSSLHLLLRLLGRTLLTCMLSSRIGSVSTVSSRRGKQKSRNKPSTNTGKDKRLKGRGRKPGPKRGSHNKK